ncbi:MAG: hypothetical protein PHX43_07465 [Alphaproteobacteria bacterium]|nr:hypothetical protein [Alphaproteobacteria bacterium]
MQHKSFNSGLLLQGLVASFLIVLAAPDFALAQEDLGSTVSMISTNQLGGIPNLISTICYIAGIVMMVGGALKLRQHSENPSQTPLSHGLSRLIVGGSIAALPPLTAWVNKTTMINGGTLGIKSFN